MNLLTNLRSFLNFEATYKIFEMVIAPIVLYSSLIHLQLTLTQKRKLQSLSNRAEKIVGGNLKIKGIENRMLQNCLLYTSPSPRDQRGSRMPSSA